MILLLILVATISLSLVNSDNSLNYYTNTKAICNETNYCQDYIISCNKDAVVMTAPITGAIVQHDVSWEDPRNKSDQELCK